MHPNQFGTTIEVVSSRDTIAVSEEVDSDEEDPFLMMKGVEEIYANQQRERSRSTERRRTGSRNKSQDTECRRSSANRRNSQEKAEGSDRKASGSSMESRRERTQEGPGKTRENVSRGKKKGNPEDETRSHGNCSRTGKNGERSGNDEPQNNTGMHQIKKVGTAEPDGFDKTVGTKCHPESRRTTIERAEPEGPNADGSGGYGSILLDDNGCIIDEKYEEWAERQIEDLVEDPGETEAEEQEINFNRAIKELDEAILNQNEDKATKNKKNGGRGVRRNAKNLKTLIPDPNKK